MRHVRLLALAAIASALPAAAQQSRTDTARSVTQAGAPVSDSATAKPKPKAPRYIAPAAEIQYLRPVDTRGLNVFESPKVAGAEYTGLKLAWGGAFTQQFQNL